MSIPYRTVSANHRPLVYSRHCQTLSFLKSIMVKIRKVRKTKKVKKVHGVNFIFCNLPNLLYPPNPLTPPNLPNLQ